MPVTPPPAPAKGTRHPGAGRQKGTPNRITVELRTFASQLVNDCAYQHRLRRDFRLRRVHPSIEALIWTYHVGKPRQQVDITAAVEVDATARFAEVRRALSYLDMGDLERFHAESQRIVDEAMSLASARGYVTK